MKCQQCGWENTPDSKECPQCGSSLTDNLKITTYPPRARRKSKFSLFRIIRRYKRTTFDAFGHIPAFLTRINQRTRKYIYDYFPTYWDIFLITIGGFIPGLLQFKQGRSKAGWYIISSFLLFIFLFAIFFHSRISNYFLYINALLLIFSSYNAVCYYFNKRKLRLNRLIRTGIALTSISLFFLTGTILRLFLGIYILICDIDTEILYPVFSKGEQVLALREPFFKNIFNRGDIVVINSIQYPRYTTSNRYGSITCCHYQYIFESPSVRLPSIAFVVGLPDESIKIENAQIYSVRGESDLIEPPVGFVVDSQYFFLPLASAFVVLTYNQNHKHAFEQVSVSNIIGKPLFIINPPEKRRIIR